MKFNFTVTYDDKTGIEIVSEDFQFVYPSVQSNLPDSNEEIAEALSKISDIVLKNKGIFMNNKIETIKSKIHEENLYITTFSKVILKRIMLTNSISDLLRENGNFYAVLSKLKELKSQELVIYDGDFICLTDRGECVAKEDFENG